MKMYVDQTSAVVADIKRDAGQRILKRYPDFKQRNMQIEFSLLLNKRLAGMLSKSDRVRLDELISAFEWIARMREHSDQLERHAVTHWIGAGEWPE